MLLPFRPPLVFRSVRLLHSSLVRRDLIGPPDPISHIRPVIYDDAPERPRTTRSSIAKLNHPYSLTEFEDYPIDESLSDMEFQWKLKKQDLDIFHQNFWTDSNTRFEAAKQSVLAGLPESSTAMDKENALLEFYKKWVMQEKDRTDAYMKEWRKRNVSEIVLAARVHYSRFICHISRLFTFTKT